jgi:hypothetical protein
MPAAGRRGAEGDPARRGALVTSPASPDDVAAVVALLLSALMSFVTGAVWEASGGIARST